MKAIVREARDGEVPTFIPPGPVTIYLTRAATESGEVVHLPVDPPVRLTAGRGYVTEVIRDGEPHRA
jgi:hypothetical protein